MSTAAIENFDVVQLGQVFTPEAVVDQMIALRKNYGSVLEPSCGNGAFSLKLGSRCVAIEIDGNHAPGNAICMDFFDYEHINQFDTIIGNPPYVRYQDIRETTKAAINSTLFDKRSNLYLFFIEKCLRHLKVGGELIFITPRDFTKATSSALLNSWLFEQGTITHFFDLGDTKIFNGATPNCAIWRFEKGDYSRKTVTLSGEKNLICANGQLLWVDCASNLVKLGDLFSVKVGAVSGADEIFVCEENGNEDFVFSKTAVTGETRKMIWPGSQPPGSLILHKNRLMQRKVAKFSEKNWWTWGRSDYISDSPRIYVNGKTRNRNPFFVHQCKRYDGSILALFPKEESIDTIKAAEALNKVDWGSLGFVCDGRFLFSQRSLEEVLLPGHIVNELR